MKQMIVAIDEATDLSELSSEILSAISAARIQWPESQMVGTIPVDGKKLVLILAPIDRSSLQEQIDQFGLDWQILASEDEPIDHDLILPYMAGTPVYNDEDDSVDIIPVTDITGKLQYWSGHSWQY